MKHLIILSVFATILLASCGKPAHEVNPLYVGTWESSSNAYEVINIQASSQATYNKLEGITTVTATGKAKVNSKQTKLYVGIKSFKIEQTPTYDSTAMTYVMILDGKTFYRY